MDFLRKHLVNIVFVGGLLFLIFGGGFSMLQSILLPLVAGQPKVIEEPAARLDNYNWQLVSLEGKPVNFSEFEDKLVFVNFWATWCGPCVAEFPSIEKLHADYGDKIAFVLINGDNNAQAARDFVAKKSISTPVYRQTQASPAIFESRSIPASYLLDKDGSLLVKKVGAANWNGAKIRSLIDSKL